MKTITIPMELFKELMDNTEECRNRLLRESNDDLAKMYQKDLDECYELKDKHEQ